MSDGTLSVRRRQPKASEGLTAHRTSEASLRATTLESFLGGTFSDIGLLRVRDRTKSKPVGDVDEFKVESKRRRRLKVYDRYLKGFKYSAALDSALQKVGVNFFGSWGQRVNSFKIEESSSCNYFRAHSRTSLS
jgi:U3 small nucleolar RNA-associated protein 15